ncbi:MAG: hypothetical protein CL533_18105 [Afipia sp.]|nr:hypothetical protein [Afipia sp.]OUX59783.1 MAG: hypothetical protein CBB64_18060 [Afipia sp. TMED4]HAO42297.1 hypothetical protein [Afipia sp.]
MIVEDPEEGQDAIAEERDWFAAGKTTCVLRPFPSPEAAGNAAASRDGPPSHSAAIADPDRPRPAGGLPIPTGTARPTATLSLRKRFSRRFRAFAL